MPWNEVRTGPADADGSFYNNPDSPAWQGFTEWLAPGGVAGTGPWRIDQHGSMSGTGWTVLSPSGDSSGSADTAVIAAVASDSIAVLAPGNWYVRAPAISATNLWLRGCGPGTIINVIAGQAGITLAGATGLHMSDMQFSVGANATGLTVNGAADSLFDGLMFTGSTAAGGVLVNGDDATEQHWRDCVFRAVGGTAWSYVRTTSTDTGGMYLSRVRCVAPPAAAAHGISFTSTAGTGVNGFADQCVADNYRNHAVHLDSVSNFRFSQLWAGLNSGANAGQAPLHIAGSSAFNMTFNGCYLSQPLSGGFCALLDGTGPHEIMIGGGTIFDGSASALGLGLAASGGVGVILGSFHQYVGGALTDTPANLTGAASVLSTGSGAPSKPNGGNPVAGQYYLRTDTPGTANQRLYVCTTGGASPVWAGIS